MVLVSGQATIALTFPESAEIPLANMMNPRKTISNYKKEHLAKLMGSFSSRRTSKANRKCFKCSSIEGLYIMLSSKYTTKNFLRKGRRI